MLFNTIEFFWFFLLVVPIYFLLPHRVRWCFLLGASYYFYMQWNATYALLILLSTVIDYFAGLWIGKATHHREKVAAILCSLACNLGLLFTFKYYNFISQTLNQVSELMGGGPALPYHDLLLPVGISFYTFQTLSYTLDVYTGKREPERHFGLFALYVSFFPQLVAGPIERSTHLMPQFHEVKRLRWENIGPGLHQILTGLIKKVVIADRLAVLVNTVYGDIPGHTGGELALATAAFAFQIYCDFSGYSDIAIGAARILDFSLMENFRRPYFSRSVGEFWHRWHISLSTWFRDYVYIPMGGSRGGRLRTTFNLLFLFALSGFWHGASFNFIVWGLLNGFYLLLERLFMNRVWERLLSRYPGSRAVAMLQGAFTFILICITWVFFRAASLPEAFQILQAVFTDPPALRTYALGLEPLELMTALLAVIALMTVELFRELRPVHAPMRKEPFFARLALFYVMAFTLILLGVYGNENAAEFIYFAF